MESDENVRLFVLMVGLPGSGKSTLRNGVFPDAFVVCPDDAIGYTKEKPWTPNAARFAWVNADKTLREAFADQDVDTVLLDATNVAPKRRKKYINMAKSKGLPTVALVCSAPEKECIRRNAARDEFRRVPDEAMKRMGRNFEMPSIDEGFIAVVVADTTDTKQASHVADKNISPEVTNRVMEIVGGVLNTLKNFRRLQNNV